MKLLLDTHLLLWIVEESERLPTAARVLLDDPANEFLFSVVNLWEIAIKRGLGRKDFLIEPRELRRELIDGGYRELIVNSEHAMAVESLPPLHKDPFDRMLIAQAMVEGITLLTTDSQVGQYPGAIRKI